MASQNLVSKTIEPQNMNGVFKNLADARSVLDLGVSLTPDQIKSLAKAGDLRAPLLEKAEGVMVNHPEVLARNFDEAKYRLKSGLIGDLTLVHVILLEMAEMVSNTIIAAKSDQFRAALDVYELASRQADNVPGLNVTIASMAEHFKRAKSVKKPDEPPAVPPASVS